jgi:hypothetical protein
MMDGYNFLHYTLCEGRLADIERLENLSAESYYAVIQAFRQKLARQDVQP